VSSEGDEESLEYWYDEDETDEDAPQDASDDPDAPDSNIGTPLVGSSQLLPRIAQTGVSRIQQQEIECCADFIMRDDDDDEYYDADDVWDIIDNCAGMLNADIEDQEIDECVDENVESSDDEEGGYYPDKQEMK